MKNKKGFTLIELLITVAIVGILSAVAYPSYLDNVQNTRRTDAQSALLGLSQAMERHYTTNGTYEGAAIGAGDTGAPTIYATRSPELGSTVYYNLTIASAGVSTYTLSAQPVNAQADNGMLVLTSTGARGWDVNNSQYGTINPTIEAGENCWSDGC